MINEFKKEFIKALPLVIGYTAFIVCLILALSPLISLFIFGQIIWGILYLPVTIVFLTAAITVGKLVDRL